MCNYKDLYHNFYIIKIMRHLFYSLMYIHKVIAYPNFTAFHTPFYCEALVFSVTARVGAAMYVHMHVHMVQIVALATLHGN